MPTNSMEKAAKTFLFNADLKTQNTMIKMEHKFASSKLWSDSPTSAHVTDLAENLILTEWRKGKDYMSYRSNTRRWFVCHKNENVSVDVGDEDLDDDLEDSSDSKPSDSNNTESESGESLDAFKVFRK